MIGDIKGWILLLVIIILWIYYTNTKGEINVLF